MPSIYVKFTRQEGVSRSDSTQSVEALAAMPVYSELNIQCRNYIRVAAG
jgi:hypothetical protein